MGCSTKYRLFDLKSIPIRYIMDSKRPIFQIDSIKKLPLSKISPNSNRLGLHLLQIFPIPIAALAQQLRVYSSGGDDDVSKEIEDRSNKVVSQVGFPESSTLIGQTLKQAEYKGGGQFNPKKAAVLVCLFEGDNGELRVILTKRSSSLNTHSGEVALPGGKMEEGDKDEADAATREAHEEIGLDPALVNVVTFLEPFLSKHNLRVIPVIGILSNKEAFKPLPNEEEVDSIFDAPLEMFIKDENRRVEEREWMGCKYLIHFFDYNTDNKKYVIWGLTAAILIRAASVVYQRSPAFLSQNPNDSP